MYGVVLMAALTTGAGAQDCHFHGGCYSGCYGGCYSSYCSGCYGSGYGCYGGCYGCYGGCYGSCYSSYSYGCYGGWGGCYGGGWGGCYGGCYGGYACYGPAVVTPVTPAIPSGPMPGSGPKPKDGTGAPEEVRAKLTVQLPEDAKLYVDGVLMKTASAKRSFVTPLLQTGKTYYYTLKAEMVRDGQTVVVNGQVVIQPGQDLQAVLSEPTAKGTFVVTNSPQ